MKLYEKVSTTKDIEIPLEKFVVISSYLLFFYNTIFFLSVHKKKHIVTEGLGRLGGWYHSFSLENKFFVVLFFCILFQATYVMHIHIKLGYDRGVYNYNI